MDSVALEKTKYEMQWCSVQVTPAASAALDTYFNLDCSYLKDGITIERITCTSDLPCLFDFRVNNAPLLALRNSDSNPSIQIEVGSYIPNSRDIKCVVTNTSSRYMATVHITIFFKYRDFRREFEDYIDNSLEKILPHD